MRRFLLALLIISTFVLSKEIITKNRYDQYITFTVNQQPDKWTIKISKSASDKAAFLWNVSSTARLEYAGCVIGKIKGKKIIIEDVRLAHIREATETSVNFDICENEYENVLAYIHSHLYVPRRTMVEACALSAMDVESWLEFGDTEFTAVQCAPYKWAWYFRTPMENIPKERRKSIDVFYPTNHNSRWITADTSMVIE